MNKKQLQDLKMLIVLNGGVTITKHSKLLSVNSGYMVSLKGYETKTTLNNLSVETLNNYIIKAKKINAYVGLWLDNNILYIDLSVKVLGLKYAKDLGYKNKQIAIYDLAKQESIYLSK